MRGVTLVVQHHRCAHLSCGGIDPKGPGVSTAECVGQRVTLGVISLNRCPEHRTSPKTLSHRAHPGLSSSKVRCRVDHRCCDDGVGGDRLGGFARAVAIAVGGAGPQIVAHITGDGDVAVGHR